MKDIYYINWSELKEGKGAVCRGHTLHYTETEARLAIQSIILLYPKYENFNIYKGKTTNSIYELMRERQPYWGSNVDHYREPKLEKVNTMIKKVTAFEASDGSIYKTSQEADKHNEKLKIQNRKGRLEDLFADIFCSNNLEGFNDEDKFVEHMMFLMEYCDSNFTKFRVIKDNFEAIIEAWEG